MFVECTHIHARWCASRLRGRKEDGWRSYFIPPVMHPPKSTAAAYNVYPFSGGGGGRRRHPLPRHSPFFGALKPSPGTPELRAGTRCV